MQFRGCIRMGEITKLGLGPFRFLFASSSQPRRRFGMHKPKERRNEDEGTRVCRYLFYPSPLMPCLFPFHQFRPSLLRTAAFACSFCCVPTVTNIYRLFAVGSCKSGREVATENEKKKEPRTESDPPLAEKNSTTFLPNCYTMTICQLAVSQIARKKSTEPFCFYEVGAGV
jgi:hypothetical protein